MKEVKIISATKHDLVPSQNTPIRKSISKLLGQVGYTIEVNNKNSLASVYNKHITEQNRDKILIFAHDDCVIEDSFLVEKVNNALETFDVIGLAGIKSPITIKEPCLWHLLGERQNMSGAVAHFAKESTYNGEDRFMTSFGVTPARVILLDGVFLAINTAKALDVGLRFDESNPAKFHFYDLHLSLDANRLGLKLGTWPIWASHKSHGLEQVTQDWLDGQKYFINRWS